MTREQIIDAFTYHPPTAMAREAHQTIRAAGKVLALKIAHGCKDSRETSLAITKLREVIMWASASIAINGIRADYPDTAETFKGAEG